jgi:hypothetical protein
METPLHPTVIHTRHVLAVKNLAVSARYFREQLGFKRDFTVEGWEFLSLGNFKVMLGECPDEVPAADFSSPWRTSPGGCENSAWSHPTAIAFASGRRSSRVQRRAGRAASAPAEPA